MTPSSPPRTCSAGVDVVVVVAVDLLEDVDKDVAGEYLRCRCRRSCCVRAMVAVTDSCSPSAEIEREEDKGEEDNEEEPKL